MKIICTDNFARETVADILVCENIKNKKLGEIMLKGLKETCTEGSSDWYILVEDDYKLSRGMKDLI